MDQPGAGHPRGSSTEAPWRPVRRRKAGRGATAEAQRPPGPAGAAVGSAATAWSRGGPRPGSPGGPDRRCRKDCSCHSPWGCGLGSWQMPMPPSCHNRQSIRCSAGPVRLARASCLVRLVPGVARQAGSCVLSRASAPAASTLVRRAWSMSSQVRRTSAGTPSSINTCPRSQWRRSKCPGKRGRDA